MWALETLDRLNERACREYAGRRTESPAMALAVLGEKLVVGPPSLRTILDLMTNSKSLGYFHDLVREYLPKHEREIMHRDIPGRIQKFIDLFSDQYFPIEAPLDDEIEGVEWFVDHIPV